MADLEKTVSIIFGAMDSNLSKTVKGFEKDFDALDSSLGKITGPLADAASSIEKYDAALAALVIGGMALAIHTAAEMSAQYNEVAEKMHASGTAIDAYKVQVNDYAASSSRAYGDVTGALATMIQKGVSSSDALQRLGDAEKLAVATQSDLKSSAALLTTVMNGYGASIDQAAHYGDVFTQGIKIGAGSIPELSNELGKVSGIASGLGIPIETLIAALGALGSYGVDTGTALGGLRFMMNNLLKPSTEAADLARKLGISFDAAAIKTRGLEQVMWDAYKATGGNAEQMKILFGSVRGLNVAFDLAKDSSGIFRQDLELTRNSAGLMSKDYDEFINTMGNVNTRFKNSFDQTLGDIGGRILPTYAEVAGALGDLFKGVKVGVDAGAFDPLFAALKEAGSSFATFIEGVAKALPEALKGLDFSGLLASFGELGRSIASYLDGLDLTKPEDLHKAIQGIIDTITTLIQVTDGMVEAFKPFYEAIKEFVQGVNSGDKESKDMAGSIMALAQGIELFGAGLVGVGKIAQEYGLSIKGAFNLIAGSSQIMWNGLQILGNAIQALFIVIEGSFLTFIDMMSGGILGKYSETFKKMVDVVTESGKEISANLEKNGLEAASGLDKFFKGFDQLTNKTAEATEAARKLKEEQDRIAAVTEKKFQLSVEQTGKMSLDDVAAAVVKTSALIDKITDKKTIDIEAKPDFVEIDGVITWIGKAIPKEKKIEVSLEEKKLQEQAKIIDTAIQWKAKIDISEIEAGTARMKMMFDSVDLGITSTATSISSLFTQLGSTKDLWNQSKIFDQINKENALRQKEFDLQEKLINQRLEMNAITIERMRSGKDIGITVKAEGIEPALETILWEILKKVQLRANESNAEFLLGMG